MRLRAASILLGVVITSPVAGCRSLRPDKVVKVETVPPGGVVLLNGLKVGTAPCELVMPYEGVLDFQVLPPPDFSGRLFSKRQTLYWKKLPASGAVAYFDLRLEQTEPLTPIEVRQR